MFAPCLGSILLAQINFCGISLKEVNITLPGQALPIGILDQHDLSPKLSEEKLYNLAKIITVKVFVGRGNGSGIIIHKQGHIYTVLTNQHVLTPNKGNNYQIQTHDGKFYPAYRQKSVTFEDNDLGLLEFTSPNINYAVAVLGSSSPLAVGDEVFAAGFPWEADPSKSGGFVFTTGQISLLMDRAFIGGYQNGYTNNIEPGMSGGPLLNRWGEVVAINGGLKYPLWGNPYVFEDGSLLPEERRQEVIHYSWGIPINTFLQFAPEFSFHSSPAITSLVSRHDLGINIFVNKVNRIYG